MSSSSHRTKRVSSVEACQGVSAKKKTCISVYDSQDDTHDSMIDIVAVSQCAKDDIHDSMRDVVTVPQYANDGKTEAPSSPAQHSSPDASTVKTTTINKAKRVLPQLIKFKKCRSIGTNTDLIDPTWIDKGPGADSCFNFVPCVEKQARLFDNGTTTTEHSEEDEYKPMSCTDSHSAVESVFIVQTKKRPTVPLEDWPCHVCGVPAPRQGCASASHFFRIRILNTDPDPDPIRIPGL